MATSTIGGAEAVVADDRRTFARPTLDDAVELGCAALVIAVYALAVVPKAGGRDGNALLVGLGTTAGAFVVARAWRHLRPAALLLAAAVAVAALLVCVVTPAAAAGFRDAAGYAYAAVTFCFVAALARTPARRNALVVVVCGLGLDEFRRAFLPWWGGEDATRQMIGTFYWHNQFAAYLLAIALTSAVAAVFATGVLRRIGVMLAPLFGAAVLLSASRGCLLLLVVSWLAIGVAAAAQATGRTRALLRWLLVAVALVLVSTALTSSFFFPSTGSGTGVSAVETRNQAQTADANLAFRADHDRAALAVFAEHPVAGVGYESYAAAASRHLPFGLTRSLYVHNGYLQAATDGGLVLLLPFLLALGACLLALARTVLAQPRRIAAAPAEAGFALAGAALLAHSAIDVDWTYPALVAMTAALLGAAVSSRLTRTDGVRRRHSLAAGVLLAGVTLLSIAGVARWMQVDRLVRSSAAAGPDTDAVVRRLLAADSRYLPDGRLSARALTLAVPDEFTGGSTVSADVARTLLRHSQRTAANDAVQQMQRAQLLAASGDPAAGLRLAQRILAHEGSARPFLQGEYAELLAATGRRDEALDLLAVALADPQLTVERPPAQLVALTATLARLAGTDPPARVVCALWDARARVTSVVPATLSNGDRPQACP